MGGKKLIEVPGYLFQALVTNLSDAHGPLAVWRDYNKRAGCECVIKELDEDFALPKLILSKFWATEAALSFAVISENLVVLFQQKLGWQHERITTKTMRYWMFVTEDCRRDGKVLDGCSHLVLDPLVFTDEAVAADHQGFSRQ